MSEHRAGTLTEIVIASRRPVLPEVISRALADAGCHRWQVESVLATPSTNTDLAARAQAGGADGTVLIAEEQTAGKGRLGRTWTAPAGSGLTLSMLLRLPEVPTQRRGWVGAILGLALVRGCATVTGLTAILKWPNDLLIDGMKCAGILAELAGDAVVVGAGLNVTLQQEELPRADATSLALSGALVLDREALAAAVLAEFDRLLARWSAADGDVDTSGIRAEYLAVCGTIGAQVRVELPEGRQLLGRGLDVTPDGAIVVLAEDGSTQTFHAGDVVHLRAVSGSDS